MIHEFIFSDIFGHILVTVANQSDPVFNTCSFKLIKGSVQSGLLNIEGINLSRRACKLWSGP